MTDKDGNLLWFGDYYGWGLVPANKNKPNKPKPLLKNLFKRWKRGERMQIGIVLLI